MRREHGQAGIELLAILPLLVLLAALGLQALAWARAGVAAEDAATRGARAAARGDDGVAAARAALRAGLRRGADVEVGQAGVRVRVRIAPLVPLWPALSPSAVAT